MGSTPLPIAVLGSGSWGTALAIQFARAGTPVRLWGRDGALLDAIFDSGEFLPELLLADVRGLSALAGDQYLRRPKPAEVIPPGDENR